MENNFIFKILNKIPWDDLKALDGTCSHIPEALKGITSETKEISNKSYWKIDNHVVVQGGLFEGAFYLVPFLIALLKDENIIERSRVYDLLFEIGNGSAEPENFVIFKPVFESFLYYLPDTLGIKCPLQIACRNAVLCGIQTYLNEITDQKSINREKALELFCMFQEHQYYIVSSLSQLINKEKDKRFKERLELSINEFD